jgi:transcriptional regulator with XRE-family HTH domain
MRLAGLLRDTIRDQGVSIRSLEIKMGVGNSVFQKALKGRTGMTIDTLLQIADALDLEWSELFRRAYLGVAPKPPSDEDELDRRVLALLRRYGVIPEPPTSDE